MPLTLRGRSVLPRVGVAPLCWAMVPAISTRLLSFVKLGRPQFLLGGLVFYGLGAALAAVDGASFDWRRYAWGQGVVTTIQLMTHYSNDYFDLEADRANSTPTRWSGGSRVLPSGAIPPARRAYRGARAGCLCADLPRWRWLCECRVHRSWCLWHCS